MPLQVVAPTWHMPLQLSQGTGLGLGWVSQQHPLELLPAPVLWEFPRVTGRSCWDPPGDIPGAGTAVGARHCPGHVFLMCVVPWQGYHSCWLSCPFLACTRLADDWHILVAAALISSMQS